MSRLDFDGGIPGTVAETKRRPSFQFQAFGEVFILLIMGLVGLAGYKIYSENVRDKRANLATAEIEQLRQQLADTQRRLDLYEKHRKPNQGDAATKTQEKAGSSTTSVPVGSGGYQVISASENPAIAEPAATAAPTFSHRRALAQNSGTASAGTGAQAGRAVEFALRDSGILTAVGPYTLQLKSIDTQNQRYSVCVYVDGMCVDSNDRSVGEVVVFSVAKDATFQLVATKISRDHISGYVILPADSQSGAGEQATQH